MNSGTSVAIAARLVSRIVETSYGYSVCEAEFHTQFHSNPLSTSCYHMALCCQSAQAAGAVRTSLLLLWTWEHFYMPCDLGTLYLLPSEELADFVTHSACQFLASQMYPPARCTGRLFSSLCFNSRSASSCTLISVIGIFWRSMNLADILV